MSSVLRLTLALAAVAALAVGADSALAQRGRGGIGLGGPGGPGGGGVTQLLQDENVRKELDLVDEQVSELEQIGRAMRERVQSELQGFDFGSLRNLPEEDRNAKFAEMRQKTEKLTAEAQKDIDQVLLPPQRERLKQIEVQSRMRFRADQALMAGSLADELGINDDQKKKLAAKHQEVEAALQEKIAKLRQEAQNELFSVLEPSQQAKLKEMIGKPFTFSNPPGFGGGFGGAGGFGGRGRDGDRPQRPGDRN